MVVAKNNLVHENLIQQFKSHSIIRKYLCFSLGNSIIKSGTIEKKIARHPKKRTIFCALDKNESIGKTAKTDWKILQTFQTSNIALEVLESIAYHENENCTIKSLFEKKLANYWMHNGMIQIEGKKMSKSLGNFATIRELTATFEPEVIRFFILQSHYRQEVVFSHEALKQAHTTLDVLYFSLLLFYEEYETDFKTLQKIAGEVEITEFLEKLADDLNSPLAIAKLLEWSKELNKSIKDKNKAENLVVQFFFLSFPILLWNFLD